MSLIKCLLFITDAIWKYIVKINRLNAIFVWRNSSETPVWDFIKTLIQVILRISANIAEKVKIIQSDAEKWKILKRSVKIYRNWQKQNHSKNRIAISYYLRNRNPNWHFFWKLCSADGIFFKKCILSVGEIPEISQLKYQGDSVRLIFDFKEWYDVKFPQTK